MESHEKASTQKWQQISKVLKLQANDTPYLSSKIKLQHQVRFYRLAKYNTFRHSTHWKWPNEILASFSVGGALFFVFSAMVIITHANYKFPLIFITKKPLLQLLIEKQKHTSSCGP